MSAIRQDITIEQGADYDTPFFLQDDDGSPRDLTGCSFVMQFRYSYDSPAILTLSSADGTLTVDVFGVLRPFIGYATTESLYATTLVYDLRERTPNGRVRRCRQGNATVTRQVTTALPGPTQVSAITTEDGGSILQEDGSKILTEDGTAPPGYLLAEDGGATLNEDGTKVLTEDSI